MLVGLCLRALVALWISLFFLYVPSAFSADLNFKSVLAAALKNSYDTKIFQADALAGNAFVREAKAEYYPKLSVRFGNDFIHSFTEKSGVVAGGDLVIADESSYRHSLISSLSYTLYDFGVRKLTVENARRQVNISQLQERHAYLETYKAVLEHYSNGLKFQKQIFITEKILDRQNAIFRLAKQLRIAGTLGREQVGIAALDLAETLNQLDDLKLRLQDVLAGLSFYTQQDYGSDGVVFRDFAALRMTEGAVNLDAVAEVRIYQQQIDSKKAELSMVKRSMLPKLMIYGSHRMFGSDTDEFGRSLLDLTARDATVSVVLEWPLFSGFADTAKRGRLHHEINSLHYQKEKKKAELHQEISSLTDTYQFYQSIENKHRVQMELIADEQEDATRLADQQVTDQINFHRKMVELNRLQLEQELWRVDYATSALALDFMNRAGE